MKIETMTLTLTDFLLARIAEDAEDADSGKWRLDPNDFERVIDQTDVHVADVLGPWNARHIARHDPARVLAECEAKRRIVEDADVADRIEDDLGTAMERDRAWPYVGERILRALAAVYADHPDYRPEWRP